MQRRPGIVVAIDIGGVRTALVAADLWTREEIARDRCATPSNATPEDIMDVVAARLGGMLRGTHRTVSEVFAVGCAVPGQVDDFGNVRGGGDLGWSLVGLRDLLAMRFNGVPVFVDRDANAGALGEVWRGRAAGMKNFVFLALGTGIGAGIVAEGQIIRGAHHGAGEIGDVLASDEASHTALSDLLGAKRIRARARELVGEEVAPRDLLMRAVEDPRLRGLADELVENVTRTVIAVSAVLDPQAIVFGGSTSAAGDALLERVRARMTDALVHPPELLLSALGEDAQLHGALFGALDTLGAELVRPTF